MLVQQPLRYAQANEEAQLACASPHQFPLLQCLCSSLGKKDLRTNPSPVLKGRSLPLHTKIEFSRRNTTEEAKVEPIAASVLADYQLMPQLARHYPLAAALRQKVGALTGRSTVQARDVFDLTVLLAKAGGETDALRPVRAQVPKAIERAKDVSFADFKSQVVSYLKTEHVDEYARREAWDALQGQVVAQLEKVL